MSIKRPSIQDARMCLDIRKRSKSGRITTEDEIKFCHEIYREFPEWYSETSAEVFNDTVPFGSHAKHPDTKESQ